MCGRRVGSPASGRLVITGAARPSYVTNSAVPQGLEEGWGEGGGRPSDLTLMELVL